MSEKDFQKVIFEYINKFPFKNLCYSLQYQIQKQICKCCSLYPCFYKKVEKIQQQISLFWIFEKIRKNKESYKLNIAFNEYMKPIIEMNSRLGKNIRILFGNYQNGKKEVFTL